METRPWSGGPLDADAVALVVDVRRGAPPTPEAGSVVLAIHGGDPPSWASVAVRSDDLARDLSRAVVAAVALGTASRTLRIERIAVAELIELICHDLRNPLAAIRANLSMLGTGDLDPDSTEAIEDSMMAGDNALRIVDNLSTVGAIESGRARSGKGVSDARAAVLDAARRARATSEAAAIPVTTDVPDGSFPCAVAPHTLVALLDNVLSVALRYAPRGSDVRIRLERHPTTACVVVSEAAAAVPPALADRIFDRAFQAESKRVAAGRYGRGLGLYVVQLLASTCGATVACRGDGGRNAYWLELPLSPDEA